MKIEIETTTVNGGTKITGAIDGKPLDEGWGKYSHEVPERVKQALAPHFPKQSKKS